MRDEVARRLVHASGTLVPAAYVFVPAVSWRIVRLFLLASVVVAIVLEALRLSVGLDWAIYDRLTREYEQDNPAGYALYVLGMAAVALAFSPLVALPAMLMLTIGDPISGLLGSGSRTKQAYVLLVTFGVTTFLASLFVPPLAAVLGGATATVADGIKPEVAGYVLDDNFTIPVGGGTAMFLAIEYLPAVA